ncbi:MAG: DUF2169 domain-containing protein [Polyangiaceae bacterium]
MEVASLSSLPLGLLLWNGPEPRATLITKVTLAFDASGFRVIDAQRPIRGPAPSRFGSSVELDHPGDFAPRKAECDVLLTGHAHADAPSLVIGANVRIGSIRKRFYALTTERAQAIPLSSAYLRSAPVADSVEMTVGPLAPAHIEREAYQATRVGTGSRLRREVLSADFDFGFFNSAPSDQRLSSIEPGLDIRLYGLAAGGAMVHGQLPRMWPRVFVPDDRRGQGLRELAMYCDTLWIDTDQSVCELTFRGVLRLRDHGALPSRVVVTLADAAEPLDPARIEGRAVFARPTRATEPEDTEPGAPRAMEPPHQTGSHRAGESLHQTGGHRAMNPLHPTGGMRRVDLPPTFDLRQSSTDILPGPAAPAEPPSPPFRPPPTPVDPERTMLHVAPSAPAPQPPVSPAPPPVPAPVPPTPPFAVAPPPDPERTMVQTGPLRRPMTLPFPKSASAKATLDLPPEANPALAAMPFSDLRRIKTLDVVPGTENKAPLPFSENKAPPLVPNKPPPPVAQTPAFPGRRATLPIEEGTFVGPAPRPPGDPDGALPFTATGALRALGRLPPSPAPVPAAPWAPVRPRPIIVPEDTESVSDTLPPAEGASAGDTLPPDAPDPPTLPPGPPDVSGPITLVPRAFGARDTLPPTAALPAIPFAPPAPLGLGDAASMGQRTTPVGPSSPMLAPQDSAAPPPWAAGLATSKSTDRAALVGPRAAPTLGILPLEKDAALQVALWREDAKLHDVLAAHGVDEITWREHRRLRDEALKQEAESGGNERAAALHEAIEHARKGPPKKGAPSLDLAAYAAVRVVMRDADDEASVLRSRDIDPAAWEHDHRHYRKRILEDPAFAERFRALLETSARPQTEAAAAKPTPASTAALPPKPPRGKPRPPKRKMARSRPLGEPAPESAAPPAEEGPAPR